MPKIAEFYPHIMPLSGLHSAPDDLLWPEKLNNEETLSLFESISLIIAIFVIVRGRNPLIKVH